MKVDERPKTGRDDSRHVLLLLIVYLVIIGLYGFGYLFPEARVWGLNWWAYHPAWLVALFAGTALLAPFLYFRTFSLLAATLSRLEEANASRWSLVCGIVAGLVLVASFVILRNTTHFLGDGYRLIDRLAIDARFIKAWDMGASAINWVTYELLGADGKMAAEQAFQINSVIAGVLVLLITAWFVRGLSASNPMRLLFFVGLATGGYALQFFGYAENYAFLIVGVLTYTLMGIRVSEGKLALWWLLIPLAFSVSIHLWALALAPSFAYLVLRRTSVGRSFLEIPGKTKALLIVLCGIAGLSLYYLLCRYDYFFTFAFLPLVPDRFTVDNAWLFSSTHIIDIANLILLLVPGLALAMVISGRAVESGLFRRDPYPFLLLTVVFTFAMSYVFNPRLGMPRDWDLYSLFGPPLAVFCFILFVEIRPQRIGLAALFFAVMLNVLSLFPRVLAQTDADITIAHFQNYLRLDPMKTINGGLVLKNYYLETGDSAKAAEIEQELKHLHPEIVLSIQAHQLSDAGRYHEAIDLCRHAVQINPSDFAMWSGAGTFFLVEGNPDSAIAYLRVANGLNPYNASNLASLGWAYLKKQDFQAAYTHLLAAEKIADSLGYAKLGLVELCLATDRPHEAISYLRAIADQTSISPQYYADVVEQMSGKGAYDDARVVLQIGQSEGLDSIAVDGLMKKHPELRLERQ